MILETVENFSKKSRELFKIFLFISIYFNLFLSIPTYSQSDSLYHYLEIAAKNNPAVLQKFTEYQAALQKIPQAGSLSDPELSLGVFLTPMELVSGNQVADIRLMQMFPWFGVLKSAKDEMSLMANAKFELFRDAKLQVFYDVQRTWYELYKVQKEISITEKNLEILKIIERLALVKFKSGPSVNNGTTSSNALISSVSAQNIITGASGMQSMGGKQGNSGSAASNQASSSMQAGVMGASSDNSGLADIYRIQIEAGELENNIELLKNQRNTTIAQFNSYLNRPAASPVNTPETITRDSLGLSLVDLSDSMLVNNPMLGMLEYEKQSIEARKKMVTRMGYPMVGLGFNYSIISTTKSGMAKPSMNGKDMIMPMVTVTLPIYRKKYNAMINEAYLLKTASKQNYQSTANSLQTEYYQAVQSYQDAQRRIKLYSNQYQLASISLDLMMKSFSVSGSGLTDVLRVRQQTLDYELKLVEAVADLNTAIAWLKRLGNLEIYGNK
ncbi:MAG: TolC family protein [Bacteroidia bacterium]|nr:TolC family protein [Bacteroidia bacterium]